MVNLKLKTHLKNVLLSSFVCSNFFQTGFAKESLDGFLECDDRAGDCRLKKTLCLTTANCINKALKPKEECLKKIEWTDEDKEVCENQPSSRERFIGNASLVVMLLYVVLAGV